MLLSANPNTNRAIVVGIIIFLCLLIPPIPKTIRIIEKRLIVVCVPNNGIIMSVGTNVPMMLPAVEIAKILPDISPMCLSVSE